MKKHKDKTHSLMDDYKIDDTSMTVYFDGGRGLETFTFDEILENPKNISNTASINWDLTGDLTEDLTTEDLIEDLT